MRTTVHPLDRPILITGTPRSGKSCIANILKQATEFAYFNEPLMLWDVARRHHDRLTAADAHPDICSRLRNRCESAVRAAGRARYLDNLSHHALAIPFVTAVLPQAKIIHVVRNPCMAIPEMMYGWEHQDTFLGAAKRRRRGLRLTALPRQLIRFGSNYIRSRLSGRRATWGPRVPSMAELPSSCSTAEIAAFQWRQMVQIARQDLSQTPLDSWLEVRLEDLIAEPLATAERIAQFAEVKNPHAIVEYAADFIDPSRVFDKVVEPSPEEWSVIWEQVRSVASDLGYAVPSTVSTTKAKHD